MNTFQMLEKFAHDLTAQAHGAYTASVEWDAKHNKFILFATATITPGRDAVPAANGKPAVPAVPPVVRTKPVLAVIRRANYWHVEQWDGDGHQTTHPHTTETDKRGNSLPAEPCNTPAKLKTLCEQVLASEMTVNLLAGLGG